MQMGPRRSPLTPITQVIYVCKYTKSTEHFCPNAPGLI